MVNKIISLIIAIFLIENSSAYVYFNPDTFSISAYPGETKNISTSVYSDGDYSIILNSSSQFIEINPNEMMIHNGDYVNLSLTFSSNISLGKISFSILAFTEKPEPSPTIIYQGGGGGSCGIIYKNNTINKTIVQNNIIYINNCTNQTIHEDKKTIEKSFWEKYFWLIIEGLLLFIIFILLTLLLKILKKREFCGVKNAKNIKNL